MSEQKPEEPQNPVFLHFIDPLRAVFADPRTSAAQETGDVSGFYDIVASDLEEFSDEVLKEAAYRLRHGAEGGRWFPAPDVCLKTCRQVASDIEARERAEATKARRKVSQPECDWKIAKGLMKCDMGRRAAREGWALQMFEFILMNSRVPDVYEARELINSAKRVKQMQAEIAKHGVGKVLKGFLRARGYREEMLKRTAFGQEDAA